MAEAIAAIGLAANILQFLDYGGQFVNAAWKMWNSDGESTSGFSTMRTLSKDLEDVLRILRDVEQRPNNTRMSNEANAILQLSSECADVTKKILEGLQEMGLSGSNRKRGAVKAAFKQVWNGGEIKALETQLGEFRSQLTLRLLVSMRSYATKSVDYQCRILEQLEKSQSDNWELHRKVDNLRSGDFAFGSSVVSYIVKTMGSSASDGLEQALQGDLLGAMYAGVGVLDRVDVSGFVLDERRKGRLERAFLSALSYEGMLDRATMVAEAHQVTLQWVFDKEENQPWVDFPSWLRSSEQLYWTTGKAGSGKSTLMKFLTQPICDVSSSGEGREEADNLRCTEHFRHWAGGKPLIVASFYFWAAGSKIQTTREALFRTLLYQILSRRPDALPVASPNRWEVLCLFNNDQRAFGEDELREMLLRVLCYVSRETAISLFVDGVDEFDGDHDELTRFFKHIIDMTPIKICMASRPWPVFEDAFQDKPGLRMEDLTYQDIKSFVAAKFQEDSGFLQLQRREADFASKLIDEVVQKASGVFLWVRLAVSSLLEGMKFGDRVLDLRRRLESLPPDLEDLYDRILDDLDPFYFGHAAQYFQILSSSSDPPPALLLWFTDEEQVDLALRLPVMEISDEDVQIRLDTMRRRVNSRCKGLIEVARPDNVPQTTTSLRTPVQYLHATVKDYIENPKVQERLLRELGTTFDPYLSLCSGSLAMFKAAGCTCLDFYRCMRYASCVNPRNIQHMMAILDDLGKYFLCTRAWSIPGNPLEALVNEKLPPLPETAWDHPLVCRDDTVQTFLSLAVKCDVVEYVKRRAPRAGLAILLDNVVPRPLEARDKSPTTQRKFSWIGFRRSMEKWKSESREPQVGWPLLLDAIQLRSTAESASMVEVLLENGADPNHNIEWSGAPEGYGRTVWMHALGLILRIFADGSWDPKGKSRWGEIARLMLANGARTDQKTIELAVAAALGKYSELTAGYTEEVVVTHTKQALRKLRDKGIPLSFNFSYGRRHARDNHKTALRLRFVGKVIEIC